MRRQMVTTMYNKRPNWTCSITNRVANNVIKEEALRHKYSKQIFPFFRNFYSSFLRNCNFYDKLVIGLRVVQFGL